MSATHEAENSKRANRYRDQPEQDDDEGLIKVAVTVTYDQRSHSRRALSMKRLTLRPSCEPSRIATR